VIFVDRYFVSFGENEKLVCILFPGLSLKKYYHETTVNGLVYGKDMFERG